MRFSHAVQELRAGSVLRRIFGRSYGGLLPNSRDAGRGLSEHRRCNESYHANSDPVFESGDAAFGSFFAGHELTIEGIPSAVQEERTYTEKLVPGSVLVPDPGLPRVVLVLGVSR